MGRAALILGGARSGKSRFARERATALAGGGRVVYVATAVAGDEEMAERIHHHRRERPAHWHTVEAPLRLVETLHEYGDGSVVVLVDCITLWLSNLLLQDGDGPAVARERHVLQRVGDLAATLHEVRAHVVLVSNEVGMSVVPATPLGRLFRDVAGRANQTLAREADDVYMIWAGLPQKLKGPAE